MKHLIIKLFKKELLELMQKELSSNLMERIALIEEETKECKTNIQILTKGLKGIYTLLEQLININKKF